ncbi:MAG TPA: V-type ATPase 116kDa subunit family protein [Gemmatimonadales bacterium]|nr:V-type ATPase 116kDa subunit family protein [Gemmatimonadales bacterium]
MIIPMIRLRIMGPRARLDEALTTLQDTGLVHLAEPHAGALLHRLRLSDSEVRQARHLRTMTQDITGLALGESSGTMRPAGAPPTTAEFARWARAARRARRALDQVDQRGRELEAERAELARFEQFLLAFRGLLPNGGGRMQSYHLILRGEDARAVPRLRQALVAVLGENFALETADLPGGERAALLLVPTTDAPKVEHLLAQSGVHELVLPSAVPSGSLATALPGLRQRRTAVDRELAELARRRADILAAEGPVLTLARAAAEDRLLELTAREHAAATPRSFVLEGWVPAVARERVCQELARRFGGAVEVEAVDREEWKGEEAPVVLANPRLFRPFETLTRTLPLPRYGSIDPTPFLAVFFPMFFGLILGDIGYGLVLAGLAALLHWRTRRGSSGRAIAEILGPCAAFAIAFGIGFGEFFGDLGRRWFGLEALVFDRERALLPFLGLAIAIGGVHILLGLVLGVVNAARGHPRLAVGRGAALAMVVFVIVALLAGLEVLPHAFFTPAVIALLLAFPILVIAEGIIAPIELLSTLGNVLSYARIMALGTASVMMAVVANRLAGRFGSVLVGVLFGLLFHLVNFALGVFAPTVHALRLHYVEFFGKFYSPGGQQYRPLGHWRPNLPDHPSPHESPL